LRLWGHEDSLANYRKPYVQRKPTEDHGTNHRKRGFPKEKGGHPFIISTDQKVETQEENLAGLKNAAPLPEHVFRG